MELTEPPEAFVVDPDEHVTALNIAYRLATRPEPRQVKLTMRQMWELYYDLEQHVRFEDCVEVAGPPLRFRVADRIVEQHPSFANVWFTQGTEELLVQSCTPNARELPS
jgi:hypothetical protein